MKPVWIIDDDRSIRWVFEKALARENIAFKTFSSAQEALAALDTETPQVVVSDIRMPGDSGLELLQKAKEQHANLPVIIMTAYSDLESAVSAFQGGAYEYLPKPFDVDYAVELIRRAMDESMRQEGVAQPAEEGPEILGQAPAMQEVFRAIGRLAQSQATVLITGESGTGKELVARALHRHSPRAGKPFIAINTAAIPRELLESELFGHERGAFTGAQTQRRGRFEQADGRHAVPGRDRGHAAGAADAAAARAVGRGFLSRRRTPADQGQRARHRCDPPEPGSAREAGAVPRGPVSPAQRHPPAAAAAARAARRHSAARPPFPGEERAGAGRGLQAAVGGHAEISHGAGFSRQRAPAREPLPLADGDGAGGDDRGEGPAARSCARRPRRRRFSTGRARWRRRSTCCSPAARRGSWTSSRGASRKP